MALQTSQPFTTPEGDTIGGVYYKWAYVHIDTIAAKASGILYGYRDAAACASNAQPVSRKFYSVDLPEDWATFAGSLEPSLSNAIYAYAKSKDADLASAEEV